MAGRDGRAVQRRVRLADVADLAGVSIGTASKALSGSGRLRDETRVRVQDAAEELGFAPDVVARGLVVGRTFTVGVLTDDSFGRFSLPVMLGAEDALGSGDVAVMLCDSRDDPVREERYVRALDSRRVDGIIVTGRRTEAREPLRTGGAPVVYAFRPCVDPAECSVVADDVGGVELAVDHLLSLGRARIAVVSGPEHHRSAAVRAAAAVDRLRAAGLEPVVVRHGDWSEAWGRQAAADLAASAVDAPDAVVCASDQVARGVVDGLRAAGLAVPDDVAVTGFDDWDVMALAAQPPLTSVDLDLTAVGRRAAELLLRSIDGHPVAGLHTVPARLAVRGSTQP